MKKRSLFSLLFAFSLIAAGCGGQDNAVVSDETVNSEIETSSDDTANASDESEAQSTVVDSDMFTDRDYRVDYDESTSVRITLNGDTATCASDDVVISGSTVTIKDEGTYILTGTLDDGMIIVDADENDKPQLVLDNVTINSASSAPIYILEADKVFITLAQDSENTLSNGGTFTAIDENNIDAAVFSKQDLTFNGYGSLTVTSPVGHGIVSKDDLVFTSGTYTIASASHGLDANDSVRVVNAQLTIDAGKDGIHAENDDDTSLGFIYIAGGTFAIGAEGDGISAGAYMQIDDGDFDIASGDDGFHADDTLTVTDGTINISESYEGLEGLHIDVSGGDIYLVATDDGFNAAGGTDESGFGGARGNDQFGGGPMGGGSSNGSIVISGGTIYINASGDGIDANGTLEISGGYTTVCGPTQGDTATLDYDSSAVITGGTFIGTGASGMAQTFSDSEQGVFAVSVGNQSAGTAIKLEDANGNVLVEYTPELSYAVVILSSPDIVKGETYTITVGETSGSFAAN